MNTGAGRVATVREVTSVARIKDTNVAILSDIVNCANKGNNEKRQTQCSRFLCVQI